MVWLLEGKSTNCHYNGALLVCISGAPMGLVWVWRNAFGLVTFALWECDMLDC